MEKTLLLKLTGLDCTSCALNIDLTLEDLPGIINSNTSYHKSESVITYSPQQITPEKIIATIKDLGHTASISPSSPPNKP